MDTESTIAIVGISGRFPGARHVAEYWRNLRQGVESIRFFSRAEIADGAVPRDVLEHPGAVFAGGTLDGFDEFDAEFFGTTVKEAGIMDPQHRILLECAWAALEDAGYDATRFPGRIGIFAASSASRYFLELAAHPELVAPLTLGQLLIDNDKDFLATRISYKLNLRGPSMAVQTACSSSLVAVHMAAQSVLSGEADLCLAGGVSVRLLHTPAYVHTPDGIESADGHCRAFDAAATGMVAGDGAGIVVLKRLSDALRHGDHIHAVLRGSAVNNDGSAKVGFSAPSVDGQAAVIRDACALAGVDPRTIGYVEAHGTGTPMGDPIEVAALAQVFAGAAPRSCAIGSVKTNIGHLDAAAGIAGLIKAVLAVRHGELPPTLHFVSPNPRIDLEHGPFFVNAALASWAPRSVPRRAGVSSFGVGGTNAHVVIEEPPAAPIEAGGTEPEVLALSARSEAALNRMTEALAAHLAEHPQIPLRDASYTLLLGRRRFDHRRTIVASTREDAIARLRQPAAWRTDVHDGADRPVGFMFPGQGTQYVGMTRELYAHDGVYRAEFDRCADLLRRTAGIDLRRLLFPTPGEAEDAARELDRTANTQAALFAVEYALARSWMSAGVQPDAMFGHSLGEYVAACVAGVMELEDALGIVATRGRLMASVAAGRMLGVGAGEAQAEAWATDGIAIAAVNGPDFTVLSGPAAAVDDLQRRLDERRVPVFPLRTSHAFHSPMMAPIVEPFVDALRGVRLSAPRIPFLSNVTGEWIDAERARTAAYWGDHLRRTVRFPGPGSSVIAGRPWVLLEVGPGRSLTRLFRGCRDLRRLTAIATLTPGGAGEREQFRRAAGDVWRAGGRMDLDARFAPARPRRIALPTYPFERTRHFIDVRSAAARQAAPPPEAPAPIAPSGDVTRLVDEQRMVLKRQARLIEAHAASIPLTPIQHWFFDTGEGNLHHWNQSAWFRIRGGVNGEDLRHAIGEVLRVHESLRLRFERVRGGWCQRVAPDGGRGVVETRPLAGGEGSEAAMADVAARLQRSLDLETGPLVRCAICTTPAGNPTDLFIVAHHAVVDVFSWQVLIRDLDDACRLAMQGRRPTVAPPRSRFSQWARALDRWAQSDEAQAQCGDWIETTRQGAGAIPTDLHGAANDWGSGDAVGMDVPGGAHPVPSDSADPDRCLVAAGRALLRWADRAAILIDVESHGREQLAGLDLTRTTGWFTAMYPLSVTKTLLVPGGAVEAVRARRRRIPHGGLGYGALKYLSSDRGAVSALKRAPVAEVVFNYRRERPPAASSLFERRALPTGGDHDPSLPRRHLLECRIVDDTHRVRIEWHYSRNRHRRASIARLGELTVEAFDELRMESRTGWAASAR